MTRCVRPQLAFDPSMAHAIDPNETRSQYLARLLSVVPHDGTWVMENKLDGWRWQAHIDADGVRCFGGRNGKEHTGNELEIESALFALPGGTVLDGELVWDDGKLTGSRSAKVSTYVIFDVLAIAGSDVTGQPWHRRRQAVEEAVRLIDHPAVRCPPVVAMESDTEITAILEDWLDDGLEGAVLKRRDAPYLPGSRRRDGFVKIKPKQTTDARIIGWKYGEGASNKEMCGALEIMLVDTGKPTTTAFHATPDEAEAAMGRLCEIQHWGWQPSGKVRHPGWLRFRDDLEGAEVAAWA